jgi:D-glycerate 3-kinase
MTSLAQSFLDKHNLPDSYLETAKQWFDPLVEQFANQFNPQLPPRVIGINGCQGSGKSTLADYLCCMISDKLDIPAIALSLDDFYLTKAKRNQLASEVHPLLATRGVPGTHDIQRAIDCIDGLRAGHETLINRFNKQTDDQVPSKDLQPIREPVGIIILEGWCLGAKPVSKLHLAKPVNRLEEQEDKQGIWRNYVNRSLAGKYQSLFNRVDELIMLQAPSFKTVYQWRLEQEHKMIEQSIQRGLGRPPQAMNDQEIQRFIEFFQRITEDVLEQLPKFADHLFKLDNHRLISHYSQL